jgi:hypothetical protein
MSPTAARKTGATGIRAKQAQDTRAKILKAAIKVFACRVWGGGGALGAPPRPPPTTG